MANELKATVINMKSLSQNISDPVVVGAGDAAGRKLRIIFTQEAAAQFTENSKVYLSWHHQTKNIKGYNVFTQVIDEEDEDAPPTWEITYPKSMLYEGDVLACIQLVDDVSIATSVNFMIHILIDPNDGSSYTASDDFTVFQNAVITLTNLAGQMRQQMTDQKIEFEDMQLAFMRIQQVAGDAQDIAEQARQIAENAVSTATEALETIEDFTTLAQEIRDKENENTSRIDALEVEVDEAQNVADRALERTDQIAINVSDVAAAVREVAEKLTTIKCECGLKESEVIALIQQELSDYATTDQLNNQLADYATLAELANYATEEQLASYATNQKVDDAIQTAQVEHEALWNALQFNEFGFEEG